MGVSAYNQLRTNFTGTMTYITRFLGAEAAQIRDYEN